MADPSPESPLHGSCLCGGVRFAIIGRISGIGQCHCSKCRKVSGVASNAVLFTGTRNLQWLQGEHLAKRFSLPTGWSSRFCRACGSPLPLLHPNGRVYWVPAGLLDADPGVKVERHIYVASKASWDEIGGDAPQFEEAFTG